MTCMWLDEVIHQQQKKGLETANVQILVSRPRMEGRADHDVFRLQAHTQGSGEGYRKERFPSSVNPW